MRTIAVRKDGEYIGLTTSIEKDGVDLTKDELELLKPFILMLIHKEGPKVFAPPVCKDIKEKLIIKSSDDGAAFILEGVAEDRAADLLREIQAICIRCFTETMIVPQFMGDRAPMIRHRVMGFNVTRPDEIRVRYLTLGDVNNFSRAINDLEEKYPEALGG